MKYIISLFVLIVLVGCDRDNDKLVHNDVVYPELKLVGGVVEVPFQAPYIEPGFTATDIRDGNIEEYVLIDNPVDTNVLGEYTITYTIKDEAGNTVVKTRTVRVVDITSPVITLDGDNPHETEVLLPYIEPGFNSIDDHDGDITGDVEMTSNINTNTLGTYEVTYESTDMSGNSSTKTRTVKVVDTTSPIIALSGDNPMVMELGEEPYVESGFSATDNYYSSQSLTLSSTGYLVNHNIVGDYTVTYYAEDGSGNTGTATRVVQVRDTTPPEISLLGDNPYKMTEGDEFINQGVSTSDLSQPVEVTTNTLPEGWENTAGIYTLTYTATDPYGNEASVSRTIEVASIDFEISLLNIDPFVDGREIESERLSATVSWIDESLGYAHLFAYDGQGSITLNGANPNFGMKIVEDLNPGSDGLFIISDFGESNQDTELFWMTYRVPNGQTMPSPRVEFSFTMAETGATHDYNPRYPVLDGSDALLFIADTQWEGGTEALHRIDANNIRNQSAGYNNSSIVSLIPPNEEWTNLTLDFDTDALFILITNTSDNSRKIVMNNAGANTTLLEFGSNEEGHPLETDIFVDLLVSGGYLFLTTKDEAENHKIRTYYISDLTEAENGDVSNSLAMTHEYNPLTSSAHIMRGYSEPSLLIIDSTKNMIATKISSGSSQAWTDGSINLSENISEVLVLEPTFDGRISAIHYKTTSNEYRTAIVDTRDSVLKTMIGFDGDDIDENESTNTISTDGLELFDIEYTEDDGFILGTKGLGPLYPNRLIKMSPRRQG